MKRLNLLIGAMASMAVGTATVNAITITEANLNQNVENVLFNNGTQTGTLVRGHFNSDPVFNVDFTSSSGSGQLQASGGQATVAGFTGNTPFTQLTIGLENNATFTRLIINPDGTPNNNVGGMINFLVNYVTPVQSFSQLFSLDGNGANYFTVDAVGLERITSVSIQTSGGISFIDVAQVRLGGLAPASVSVPDGGVTVILLGAGLSVLGLGRRFIKS